MRIQRLAMAALIAWALAAGALLRAQTTSLTLASPRTISPVMAPADPLTAQRLEQLDTGNFSSVRLRKRIMQIVQGDGKLPGGTIQ